MPANLPKTGGNQKITDDYVPDYVTDEAKLLHEIRDQLGTISGQLGTITDMASRAEHAAGEFLPAARQFLAGRRARLAARWGGQQ
jgi:hypothetical protein